MFSTTNELILRRTEEKHTYLTLKKTYNRTLDVLKREILEYTKNNTVMILCTTII